MKVISLCSNIPEYCQGPLDCEKRILDKYPGSGFIPYLKKYLEKQGMTLLSGYDTWIEIMRKKLDPKDVHIVQEDTCRFGTDLILAGCHPALVFSLESPLYVPKFYEELEKIKKIYPIQMLFGNLGNRHVYFPSFDFDEDLPVKPFSDRETPLCMVSSNKHAQSKDPRELQTLRYQAIEFFKKEGLLHLYGKGWPPGYGNEIVAGKKIELMNYYRYALCFENIAMDGYVTEKVIDCIRAGVIPIYCGARDISDFVPKECYIDIRADENPRPQFILLTDVMKSRHLEMNDVILEAGRKFLKSQYGYNFSYQHFARKIVQSLNVLFEVKEQHRDNDGDESAHETPDPRLHLELADLNMGLRDRNSQE